MPTITISKKVLLQKLGKDFSDEELAETIPMIGTDLEGIKGDEIQVEIFPNRPDMLSEQGFSRALSSFLGIKTGLAKYNVAAPTPEAKVVVDENLKSIRPYTTCALVHNLKLTDETIKEIIAIQEKLHITYGRNRKKCAIGIYPLEAIKLPIKFEARKSSDIVFQPLEAHKEMNGNEILEQHDTGKKYAHLLEGLKQYPVFVDANNNILSMPPVINSEETGRVNTSTSSVFVECSGHDLRTLQICLNILVSVFSDIGGRIQAMNVQYGSKKIVTPNLEPFKITADMDYINKRLGTQIPKTAYGKLLGKMGMGIEAAKGSKLSVLVPCYRADVIHQVDISEDVAIAYGYRNFEPTIPKVATIAQASSMSKFAQKLAEFFVGHSMIELKGYVLTNAQVQSTFITDDKLVATSNALSEEYNVLRNWILPQIIASLGKNKHHEYPQHVFEMGTVVSHDSKQECNVDEQEHAAFIICQENADFTKAAQVVKNLAKSLNVELDLKASHHKGFIQGRCAQITLNNAIIGFVGEIDPKTLVDNGMETPCCGAELYLNPLLDQVQKSNSKL